LVYNTGSFWRQYGSVLAKIFRYALPTRTAEPLTAPA
jgi:linoleoyl-CoA desaturase